uniref:Uncharacterized protein n=1 Tax=Setaria italica TaxID=4555 RepID=K3ZBP2_SETIT
MHNRGKKRKEPRFRRKEENFPRILNKYGDKPRAFPPGGTRNGVGTDPPSAGEEEGDWK